MTRTTTLPLEFLPVAEIEWVSQWCKFHTATLHVVPSNVTSCVLIMSCMFKKQLIVIAIVDCMSYCYSDDSVSMYLIVIHSDSNVGSLFKRCFTPVMSVHSSWRPLLCVCCILFTQNTTSCRLWRWVTLMRVWQWRGIACRANWAFERWLEYLYLPIYIM